MVQELVKYIKPSAKLNQTWNLQDAAMEFSVCVSTGFSLQKHLSILSEEPLSCGHLVLRPPKLLVTFKQVETAERLLEVLRSLHTNLISVSQ